MNTMLKKAGFGVALAATALTAAVPADAQRYRGYYHDHDDGGGAIVAGIAGLAIGAALASGSRNRDYYYRERGYDPYYDDDYYRRQSYYPYDGYYAYEYRVRYPSCYIERRWDPYYRESVSIRVCR